MGRGEVEGHHRLDSHRSGAGAAPGGGVGGEVGAGEGDHAAGLSVGACLQTRGTDRVDVPRDFRTRTQWRQEGRRIRKDASPRAFFDSYYYRRTYELFSIAETVLVTPRSVKEPSVLSFAEGSIGSAMQTINDAAKRRRDGASRAYSRRQHKRAQLFSSQKAEFYDLKDAVLERLLRQGRAKVVGYHSKTDHFDPPKLRMHRWQSPS
jgi:hypothetical protein